MRWWRKQGQAGDQRHDDGDGERHAEVSVEGERREEQRQHGRDDGRRRERDRLADPGNRGHDRRPRRIARPAQVSEQRAAEADLEFGALRSEHGSFVEFGHRFGIFVLLEKKRAEGRVGDGIERIYFELPAKGGFGFGKSLLLLKREAEVIVGVFV